MSETKQEGDFKIKAPKKTEPAAKAPVEQKAEAPVETNSETAFFDKDSDTIKLDLGKLKNPQADADTKLIDLIVIVLKITVIVLLYRLYHIEDASTQGQSDNCFLVLIVPNCFVS